MSEVNEKRQTAFAGMKAQKRFGQLATAAVICTDNPQRWDGKASKT
jgi:hypothetical protein